MSSLFGGQLPPGIALGRSAWDNIPKIGQSRALAVDAFSKFDLKSPVADKVYSADDSKVVVSLKSKTTPEEAKSEETEEATTAQVGSDPLVEELLAQKTQDLLGQWQRLFQ